MNQTIVVGIITFILGTITGYTVHDFFKKTLMMSEDSSRNFLILTVTAVWFISMLVSVVNPTYQVPVAVHGIMGAIVGFFFYKGKKNE